MQNNTKTGFTVIEVLVALVVAAMLMTVASTSFFYLLRGASRAELIKEVKQNGDYALSVMDVKIRNARSIVSSCASSGSAANSITIVNPDSSQSTFRCVQSNGIRRLQEEIDPVTGPTVANFLTNSSVTIANSCATANVSFSCIVDNSTKTKTVLISFQLADPTNVTSPYVETFNAQISLRNK
ncbi:type II secretion system protein [Candidatus Microgenomates bacterium]|nr:MAG: type II secretion system protein [Candidatus Microgenomates bacterium]